MTKQDRIKSIIAEIEKMESVRKVLRIKINNYTERELELTKLPKTEHNMIEASVVKRKLIGFRASMRNVLENISLAKAQINEIKEL